MIKEIIFDYDNSIRLDNFLKIKIPEFSRTKIQRLISKGVFKVDGYVVKSSFKLKDNEIIFFDNSIENETKNNLLAEKILIDKIYEDDDILVVNKPSGLIVHPGAGNPNGTLLNGLMYYYKDNLSTIDNNRPGIIHRLDKETSGIIVIAKTDYAHYSISNQFAERKVKKKYKALVWGNLKSNGKIKGYLSRNSKNRLAYKLSNTKGKYSFTEYSVKQNFELPVSLLNVYPMTGRTHQIRVHLSSIGHSIINDSIYGGGSNKIKSFNPIFKNKITKILNIINRVALHAEEIIFFHPIKKRKVSFNAPAPEDFTNVINFLDKYDK